MFASFARFISTLVAVAALVGLGSMPAARATVVLGNLGANGTTGALSNTNTGITGTAKAAQVFTTPASSSDLRLSSITLGAFTPDAESNPFSLQVFEGNASGPFNFPGTPFATSTNTQTLGINSAGALYTWTFANQQMAASTTYWIIPPTDLNWNFRTGGSNTPTAQNSSGYVYVGGYESTNGGTSWTTDGNLNLTVSVQAVPEPSTFALVAAALGLGFCTLARRRRV